MSSSVNPANMPAAAPRAPTSSTSSPPTNSSSASTASPSSSSSSSRAATSTSMQPSSSSSSRTPPSMFNWAPQPDLFRSLQKDEYHLSQWRAECNELLSSLLGSAASHYSAELDLFARGSYFGTTSLIGRPTLGEEYCDIMQVTARDVNAEAEREFIIERSRRRERRRQQEGSSLPVLPPTASSQPTSISTSIAPSSAAAPPTSLSTPSPFYSWAVYTPYQILSWPRRVALFNLQVMLPYLYEKAQLNSRRLLFHIPIEYQNTDINRGQPSGYRFEVIPVNTSPTIQFIYELKKGWNRVISFILRSDYTLLNQFQRIHLALFYLWGQYLEWNKRLVAVEYIQLRQFDVARPGYRLFGILLFIQVFVGAVRVLKQKLEELREARAAAAADNSSRDNNRMLPGLHHLNPNSGLVPSDPGSASGLYVIDNSERLEAEREERELHHVRPHHSAASNSSSSNSSRMPPGVGHRLNEEKIDRRPDEAVEEESESESEDEEETPNCTLCLCPRENTTATECGHLYCWTCITECCTNKPECPMCRQPCLLNSLLLLAYYK